MSANWWRRGDGDPKRDFSLPLSRARLDQELLEEFRFHIEERRDQLIAEGMTPAAAEAEARRRFGDDETYRRLTKRIDEDTMRQQRRSEFFSTLIRETRHAAGVLLRQPGFSLIAFITLALGIGATTAMYAVLDAVVLRPLPYSDADQLVSVLHPATVPGSGERRWGISPGGYVHFGEGTKTLSSFGIYRTYGMTVTARDEAEVARVAAATHDVFEALRARASLGRLFGADDDQPSAAPVVVLSHEYHQQRYGGDPSVVGTVLRTEGGPLEIIGVTMPGLTLPMPGPFADASNLAGFGVDIWVPARVNRAGPFWNTHPNVGIGRLRDGATIQAANTEFRAMLARFPEQMSNAYSPGFIKQYDFRVEVSPLRDAVLGRNVPRAIWMLFGAQLLVLVIAAANVGNLFLVRMEARRREAAVRTALGAEPVHMAAHYLAESLLLCGAAAVAAVAIAAGGIKLLLAIAPTDVPRLSQVALTPATIAVALGIGLLIGVVLGVVPLFRRGLDVQSLRDGSRGLSASPRQRFARSTLVVGQIALTLMLLAGATLMLRSFDRLRHVQPGFDPANTLTFQLALPFSTYDTREKAALFHRALQDRVRALPGVTAMGGGSVPLEDFGTGCSVVFRENMPYGSGEQTPCVSTPVALPGYFDALDIDVSGRTPTWTDVDARSQAVVVTRVLADRLWPGEDPIGKGIRTSGEGTDEWYRVVGIVPELRLEALDAPPTEAVFYAATGLTKDARSSNLNGLTMLVRTDGIDPMSLVPSLRAITRELDPSVPFISPRTMDAVVGRSMARVSFNLVLLGIAGAMGLVLSAVGLYGVVSYVVAQRRTEIGIRMALGASARAVSRMVVMQSVRLAALGVAIGLAGALATGGALQAMLFEVSANDPVVLAAVALLLMTIVTLASWAPARRAAGIEPVEAMREG